MVTTSLATLLSNSPPACNDDMVCVHEVAYFISFNKRSCDGNEYQMKIWTLIPRLHWLKKAGQHGTARFVMSV